MDMPTTLFTKGYQGKNIDEFVEELLVAGVTCVIDVRRRPLSRKPGFSKTRFRTTLHACGIEYEHMPDLGMPVDLLPLRNERDNSGILSEYEHRLAVSDDQLEQLRNEVARGGACLVCFEADHTQCHRHVLARLVEQSTNLQTVNL